MELIEIMIGTIIEMKTNQNFNFTLIWKMHYKKTKRERGKINGWEREGREKSNSEGNEKERWVKWKRALRDKFIMENDERK